MVMKNFSCCTGAEHNTPQQYKIHSGEMTLAELPVGAAATIVRIQPASRGRKKFADVGIVPGTELVLESRAPFGGLLRVKILETSMALHKSDARDIVLRER
ncbi:MAG: ferrous iron transport protein A [Lentisphaeria bacterium]|nr:ferrous iron transport protein A [Lentisphaeria bacterium]